MSGELPKPERSTATPGSGHLMLALAALAIVAMVYFSAWQGSQGTLNIPITGEQTVTNPNLANTQTAGERAQGEFKVYEPFARPESLGLLAAVAGTVVLGTSLIVLARQKH